jgi:hypothetical protein
MKFIAETMQSAASGTVRARARWGGRNKKYKMHAQHNNSEMLALLLHLDFQFLSYKMTAYKCFSFGCKCYVNF